MHRRASCLVKHSVYFVGTRPFSCCAKTGNVSPNRVAILRVDHCSEQLGKEFVEFRDYAIEQTFSIRLLYQFVSSSLYGDKLRFRRYQRQS